MAATAIWKVKGNLGRVVNYTANPEKTTFSPAELQGLRDVMNYATQDYKTEEQRYVSGVNCIPEIARDEMLLVKRQFGKEGGIIAFHAYHSFAPGRLRRNRPTISAWSWPTDYGENVSKYRKLNNFASAWSALTLPYREVVAVSCLAWKRKSMILCPALGLGRLFLAPVVKPGDTGLDFF